MNIRQGPRAFLVASAIVILSGCALTTEQIELQYVPQTGVRVVNGANSRAVNVLVNDLRQDKTMVGRKMNTYGAHMAPILPTEDVAVTLQRALEQELRAHGFLLGTDALVTVTCDLTHYYGYYKWGFSSFDAVADLNMTVAVRNKVDPFFSRQISAQGIEPNNLVASADNMRLALNRALADGAKLLFEDEGFIAALLREPQN